eukprot:SM000160S02557  [mRNA]  locus=s160:270347:279571:- [translate_table: standard]
MFRALRKKTGKVKQKFEFRFLFYATQVPLTGYEKLVVSLIAVDTGKLECQTSKATVRNGSVSWTDTLNHRVKLQKDEKAKQHDAKPYKLVVSTGAGRSGVLGEVVINLAECSASQHVDERTLPLGNCAAGTVLHARIQCVPVKITSGDLELSSASERSLSSMNFSELTASDDEVEEEEADAEEYSGGRSDVSAGHQSVGSASMGSRDNAIIRTGASLERSRSENVQGDHQQGGLVYARDATPQRFAASNDSSQQQGRVDHDSDGTGSQASGRGGHYARGNGTRLASQHNDGTRQYGGGEGEDPPSLSGKPYGAQGGSSRPESRSSYEENFDSPQSRGQPEQQEPGYHGNGVRRGMSPMRTGLNPTAREVPGHQTRPSSALGRASVAEFGPSWARRAGDPSPQRRLADATPGRRITDASPGRRVSYDTVQPRMQPDPSPLKARAADPSPLRGRTADASPMRGRLTNPSPARGVRAPSPGPQPGAPYGRQPLDQRSSGYSSAASSGGDSPAHSAHRGREKSGMLDPVYAAQQGGLSAAALRQQHMMMGNSRAQLPALHEAAPRGMLSMAPTGGAGTGRDVLAELEAAEAAIEELQAESISWQRASRKLSTEVEALRSQLTQQQEQEEEYGMELSALAEERHRLADELERLQSSHRGMEELEDEEATARWDAANAKQGKRELQEELHFQSETVGALNLQIKKLQDSNHELVCAVREAEEQIEHHKKDLEELFEDKGKVEAQVRKSQYALAEKDNEWKQRLAVVIKANRTLEAKLVDANIPFTSETSSADILGNEVEDVAQSTELPSVDDSADSRAMKSKIEEMEKEMQELTDESLQLAASLTRAKKELDAKSSQVSSLEAEVRRIGAGAGAKDGLGIGAFFGGGAVAAAADAEVLKMRERITELERQLQEVADEDAGAADSGDLKFVRNRLRVVEMAMARSGEHMAVLEHADERAQHAEMELAAAKEAHSKSLKAREEADTRAAAAREQAESRQAAAREQMRLAQTQAEEKAARLEQAYQSANSRVIELEGEKERIADSLSSYHRMKQEMEAMALAAASEKGSLLSQLKGVQEEANKLRQELQVLREGQVRMEESAKLMESGNLNLENKIQELAIAKQDLERNLRHSEEQRRLGQSTVQELELQLAALREHLEQATSPPAASAAPADVEVLERRYTREKEALLLQLAVLATSKDDMQQQLRVANSEVKALIEEKRAIETSGFELQEQVNLLEQKLEEEGAERSAGEEQRHDQLMQLSALATERDKQAAAKQAVEKEVERLQAERLRDRERAVLLERQLSEQREEADGRIGKLKEDMAGHVAVRRELQAQALGLDATRAELEGRLLSMEGAHGQLGDQRTALEAQLEAAHLEVQRVRGEEERVRKQLERERGGRLEGETRATRAEESLRLQKEERSFTEARLQDELQRLAAQMTSTTEEKDAAAFKALLEASDMRAEKGRLEDQLRMARGEAMQAKEESQLGLQELQMLLRAGETEREAAKRRSEELESELDSTRRAAQAGADEAASETARLRAERDSLGRKLAEARASGASLEAERATLEVERRTLAEEMGREAEALRVEVDKERTQRASLEREVDSERAGRREEAARTAELMERVRSMEDLKKQKEVVEAERERLAVRAAASGSELERLRVKNRELQERIWGLNEKSEEAGAREANSSKSAQAEQLASKAAAVMAEEAATLRLQNATLRRDLQAAQEGAQASTSSVQRELDELRRKVASMEDDLQSKQEALALAEQRLEGAICRSPSMGKKGRVGPMGGPSPQRDGKELLELRRKLQGLETEVNTKAAELETTKRTAEESEKAWQEEIRRLQSASEHLMAGALDGSGDQLQMEVVRLQSSNSEMVRRERELHNKLRAQELATAELQRLQKVNDDLHRRLQRHRQPTDTENVVERMATLENELSEALEANNMYKEQLKSCVLSSRHFLALSLAFAEKANVDAAAMKSLGANADEVVQEMATLRRQAKGQEEELQDLRERYSDLSLRFVEVEAERQEMAMLLRRR